MDMLSVIVIVIPLVAALVGIIIGLIQLGDYIEKRKRKLRTIKTLEKVKFDYSVKSNTALIIMAHPDDSVISCGGLIVRLIERKWDVYVMIVTDGSGTLEISP